MKFSANLGFLWNDRPLADAIYAAKQAGFDAVECHWPYEVPPEKLAAALTETGLTMIGLNTVRGKVERGENGLCALPGREVEARAAIDQALDYAVAISAQNVHVMAGFANGPAAESAFVGALEYACEKATVDSINILVEPLNHYDAPGYFLNTTAQAEVLIARVAASNLKLMFDCYHVQLMEGDLSHKLERLRPILGHVQIARVPDRGPPSGGEVNYEHIYGVLRDLEWDTPIGAEYRSALPTEDTLDWLHVARNL